MRECPACKRCFTDDFAHCPTDGDTLIQSLQGEPVLDGRYHLESRLGHGGMGIVFRARHIFLKTSHAIKVVLPDLVGNDPSLVTRFRQEAMAAAAIRHPNIIAVTDFGVARGTMPFLVMEFIKGKSLQDVLSEKGRLTPQQTFEIIAAVGAGVGAAHRQGIVHRDLKPLNIMIQDGVVSSDAVKVLDFGLAKIKSGELLGSFVQAQTTGLMGSPYYMAPEQWSDEEPDRRADVYSLGIIIYQMLAGDVPFKGASMPSIMKKHLTAPPPPFSALGLSVAPQLETVIFRALEKDPDARPQTVEDFIAQLRQAVSTLPREQSLLGGTLDPMATNYMAPAPLLSGEQRLAGTVHANPGGEATMGGPHQTAVIPPAREATPPGAGGGVTNVIGGAAPATDALGPNQTDVGDGGRGAGGGKTISAAAPGHLGATNYAGAPPPETPRQFDSTTRQDRGLFAQTAGRIGAPQVDPSWSAAAGGATVVEPVLPGPSLAPPPPAPQKSSPIVLIGVAALVALLVLGGGGYGLYLALRPDEDQNGTNGQTNQQQQQQQNQTNKGNGTSVAQTIVPEMIAIPGGTFQMGTNDVSANSTNAFDLNSWPAHPVTVKPFMMQKTELTNAAYLEFVRATNHRAPADWANGEPPAGQETSPVRNVSYEDAAAFAKWRSEKDKVAYRLPTEEEWEYAARSGTKYKLYPWGDGWVDGRANVDASNTKMVGSYPQGANQWGVVDLIGNVSEWTSSQASLYPGNNRLRMADGDPGGNIQRGGSYLSKPRGERAINALRRAWSPPSTPYPNCGFRLVRDS